MKKLLALLILLSTCYSAIYSQFLLAGWDFQTTTNGGTACAAAPSSPTSFTANFGSGTIYANGTNGSSTWVTATSGNEITAFAGSAVNAGTGFSTTTNTPASIALVNTTANTKSIVFSVNMTGNKDLIISYATQRTSSGFTSQAWEYSTTGTGGWTNFSTQTTILTSFGVITLPTVTALDNISTAFIRLTVTGATATSGNNRLDNIQFRACKQNVSLAGATISGLVEQCTESGWTYYADPTTKNIHFAINKNGNTFTATPSITVGSTIVKTSSNGSNQEHGMWLMGRYWDATLASGLISSSLPVSVRFYYDPADSTSAKNARDAAFTALPGTTLAITNGAAGEWFKTPNGSAFNGTYIGNIVGNKFPNGGTILKPTVVIGTQNGIRYAEYQGLTGFSGGTLGFSFGPNNGGGANGLPVTWAGFEASMQRDYTELIWHTASEQNTSHFEVEASEDGKSFKTISENIAAAGNSASLLSYSFRDMNLAPIKYYRLRQVDIEGEFDYSKIIIAKRSEGLKQGFDMVVYPVSENNSKQYHLLLKNKVENLSHIQIADYTGKPVFHITSSKNAELLDLHYLTPGIYMIQVWNGEEKQVERVVVR
jgi:hypothetical protein